MLGKLRIDGVYCDQDPQIYQKCTDHNILRLEQRILREKPFIDQLESTLMDQQKTNYFKMNGELKLHNDLLADEITRPQDLAFEQSEAYQTKEQNAILCDRMHSYKKRYYRLHIVVGKIILNSYSQFFSEEDKLAL
jgi:heat shock protein HspQ